MSEYYVLNADHSVTAVETAREWAERFDHDNRKVAKDEIGEYQISTIFLGLDHSFGSGTPQIFETMVFKGDFADLYCDRCATYDEALQMHAKACELVRNGDIHA